MLWSLSCNTTVAVLYTEYYIEDRNSCRLGTVRCLMARYPGIFVVVFRSQDCHSHFHNSVIPPPSPPAPQQQQITEGLLCLPRCPPHLVLLQQIPPPSSALAAASPLARVLLTRNDFDKMPLTVSADTQNLDCHVRGSLVPH